MIISIKLIFVILSRLKNKIREFLHVISPFIAGFESHFSVETAVGFT